MIFGYLPCLPFLDAWSAAFWRASWQGAIAIGLVWLVCRYIPRLSPNVRCWLWRLALLKMVLAIVPWSTFDLPILPQSWSFFSPETVKSSPETENFTVESVVENDYAAAGAASTGAEDITSDSYESADSPRALVTNSPATTTAGAWNCLVVIQAVLFGLWLTVLAAFIAALVVRIRAARRWRREWRLIKDREVLTLGERLSAKLGLFQPPVLFEAESCLSPVVFGALRTAIVLPAKLIAESNMDRLRMILTHEMAHIRRGDLLGNWYSTLVSGLFFFHPGVWLALRESRLAQEVACDELAVRQPEVSTAEYGRMLVELATVSPLHAAPLVTVGVVESFHVFLKRRLNAMKESGTRSRGMLAMSWFLAGVAALGLLPWRLAAQGKPKDDEAALQARAPGDQAPAGREKIVKVEAKSGPFTLTVDRVRTDFGTQITMTPSGFPLFSGAPSNAKTDSFRNANGNSATGGSTGTMGGASGGSFARPNLILDVGLKGPKLEGKRQWLCIVSGKAKATDDQGRSLDAPDEIAWLKLMLPGVEYRQEAGRTAIHLSLQQGFPPAKYLSTVAGELQVAEGTVQRVTFADRELSQPTTKRNDKLSARLDKVRQTAEGVEIELAVSPPEQKQPANFNPMQNMEAMMKQSMLADAPGRITVLMRDSQGKTHLAGGGGSGNGGGGAFFGGGGGGGGGSSWGTSGGNGNGQQWNSGGSNNGKAGKTPAEKYRFDPLPEGVSVKSITCIVTTCLTEPKPVSFHFENVPLPNEEN